MNQATGSVTDTAMYPHYLLLDSSGNIVVVEPGCYLRKISGGVIAPIAGDGVCRQAHGDGIPATAYGIAPSEVAQDAQGNLFVTEWTEGCDVRRIDATTGGISTVAGNGCYTPPTATYDGQAATNVRFISLTSVVVDPNGDLLLANLCQIYRISGGIVNTVAGVPAGAPGSCVDDCDGGSALAAHLSDFLSLAAAPNGDIYVASYGGCRIRKISAGIITTVAGDGVCGFNGDGPANSARLKQPQQITLGSTGALFIADTYNCRVRVLRDGFLTTVAGSSVCGFSGDGGPATSAALSATRGEGVTGVALDSAGNLYIGDFDNGRIRVVYGADRDSDGDGYTDAQEGNLGKDPQQYCDLMRADANGDGIVNSTDLLVVAKAGQRWPRVVRMDQNGDGRVNSIDLLIVAKRQNRSVSNC